MRYDKSATMADMRDGVVGGVSWATDAISFSIVGERSTDQLHPPVIGRFWRPYRRHDNDAAVAFSLFGNRITGSLQL
jgi:hypothetical protein